MKWLVLVMILAAAVLNYQGMFTYTAYLFNHPLEDMSHGWLVPIVSLYAMWRSRGAFRAASGGASWVGAACVAFFLVLAWFGGRGEQTRIEQVSFIGLIWAVPFAFWGRGVERLMRFPAAYLIFTIPLSTLVDFLTIRLRLLSVVLATGFLNGVGFSVERSGTALFSHMPGRVFNVDVAEPCSGIRSLFAMMALTAAYAYFTQKENWKKCVLFVSSVPVAVVGNMVRIMSICVVASWFGQEAATGYYHDYSGFVVFLVGVYLIFFIGERIKKIKVSFSIKPFGRLGRVREDAPAEGVRRGSSSAVVVAVTVSALAVFTGGYLMPAPTYDTVSFVTGALPERVGAFSGDVPWFCQDPQCLTVAEQQELTKKTVDGTEGYACPECGKLMSQKSLGENTILPHDTLILKRNYRTGDGLEFAVNVVVQGRTRAGLHRAEVCLPSQGFIIKNARRTSLMLDGWKHPLVVRQIDTMRPMTGSKMPVRKDGKLVWYDKPDTPGDQSGYSDGVSLVYWMESRERRCCSHTQRILTDVWDRSIHNRINRWVMIAVNVSSGLDSPEGVERLEAFLSELYPKVVLERSKDNE